MKKFGYRDLTKSLSPFLLASFFAGGPAHSAVVVGSEIGVDFGPTSSTNNFNDASGNSGGIAAGSVVDTSGASLTGVGFTWSEGSFSNNDAATETDLPGQPAQFNDSNLTDWIGLFDSSNPLVFTFTGLNDSLTYDLTVGAGFIAGGTNTDTNWVAGATSVSGSTVHDVGAQAFVTLTGLTTDGSGNLAITGTGLSGTPTPTASALQLTAVPEPSAALLGALGLLALLRRRR